MQTTKEKAAMPMKPVTIRRWELVTGFIVLMASYIVMGVLLNNSITSNRVTLRNTRNALHEIQKSRLESCKRTYQSFDDVFELFFPPPAKRSAKQKHDLRKFHKSIRKLRMTCIKQVTPPPVPKKGAIENAKGS